MSASADATDRPLSAAEMRDRELLLPALRVWTAYLQMRGWHATYPAATAAGGAVELRDRSAETSDLMVGVRIAVQPQYALAHWRAHLAEANRGQAVTLSLLVQALRFMGGEPVAKFSPTGEWPPHYPRVRTARGWWHLTREMQRRLQFGHYVPVLTRKSGPRPRPVPVEPPAPAARAGRLRAVTDPLRIIPMLREYATPERATALLDVAVREHRPLCTRAAGRAPREGSATINVRTDSVVIGLIGLVAYAEAARDRYGLRVVTLDAVRGELEALERDNPEGFTRCRAFAAYDSGGTLRNQNGWWRVTLALLNHVDADADALAGEVATWRIAPPAREPEGAGDPGMRVARLMPYTVTTAVYVPEAEADGSLMHLGADGQHYWHDNLTAMSRDERARLDLLLPEER